MNTIETLPKTVIYDGQAYFLNLHVTAWGKLCVSYKGIDRGADGCYPNIFSTVVEGESKKAPHLEGADWVEGITDSKDLDDAVTITKVRIDNACANNFVEVSSVWGE